MIVGSPQNFFNKNFIDTVAKITKNRNGVLRGFSAVESGTCGLTSTAKGRQITQSFGVMKKSTLAEVLESLRTTEIERFHFGKSVLPEVITLEEKMKSMGIKVTFEDNLELAKLITKSVEKVKAKGLRVPKRIILMTPAKDKFISGICKQENNLILYNNNLIAFKEAEYAEYGMTKGFSNATAENAVFHEIGHLLHPKNVPNTDKIWKTMAKGGDIDFIHDGVSYYATMNPREFVAEVFAGLMCGKQFSKEIMEIYNALKGPQVLEPILRKQMP